MLAIDTLVAALASAPERPHVQPCAVHLRWGACSWADGIVDSGTKR
jgi:hypothetical protein